MAFLSSSFSNSFYAGSRPFRITAVSQLPNLEISYNASSGTQFNKTTSITDGTAVSSWQNAGGLTSHDWNSTGGNRPVWYANAKNGLGAVRFNPAGTTTQYLTINPVTYIQSLAGATLVILFKSSSTAAGTRYATSTDVGGFQWGQNGTQWVGGFSGSTFTVNSITADTNWHHIVLNFDGTQTGNANRLKARLDGSDVGLTFGGTVNPTTSATAGYFYGGSTGTSTTSTSNFWIGDIGEVMVWTRSLKTNEVLAVEDYLTNKWAV